MAIQVQRRRGTTAEHATFTGAAGEVTTDTVKHTQVVHDGSTAGGYPLAREDLSTTDPATGRAALAVTPANIGAATTAQGALADSAVQPGGALGTPSGGTLTNCTGLPLAGVVGAGTAAALDHGVAIGDAVRLEDVGGGTAGLPAVDGSQLLNLPGGGGSGTVTSVDLTVPTGLTATGGPITTSGVIDIAYDTGYQGFLTADKSKLDGIAAGATANSADAVLLARANHTGTQALATISDAGNAAGLNVGTSAGTVAAGDDARFTDARTPTAHAASHASGGSDPLTPASIGALESGDNVSELTNDAGYLAAPWPTLPAAIDAAWFEPLETNGATREVRRETTNGFSSRVLTFSGTVTETASGVLTPDGWYSGAGFKFKIKLVPGSGASASEVMRVGLAARFSASGDVQDVAPPAFTYVDATVVAAGQEITTSASAVLTPSGSWAEGVAIQLWMRRDTTVGSNSLAGAEVREAIIELPQRTATPTPF